MTTEKLEELGWQFDDFWNNRALFSKKDTELKGFAIFEHDGDWGIIDPYAKVFELIYCNMTDNEIEQYIDYVNTYDDLMKFPKDHTFFEYLNLKKDLHEFINNMKEKN